MVKNMRSFRHAAARVLKKEMPEAETEFTVEPSYKSGLTRRSILGILYAAVVVQPAVIWVYMATGNLILSAAIYASILLFSELAAFSAAVAMTFKAVWIKPF